MASCQWALSYSSGLARLALLGPLLRGALVLLLAAMAASDGGAEGVAERGSGEGREGAAATVVELQGEVVSSAVAIGMPSGILWAAGHLWISDLSHDPAIHLLDAETRTLKRSMGRRGDGPGEFQSVPQLLLDPRDESGAAWGWDGGPGRLTRLEPDVPAGSLEVVRVAPSEAETVVGGVRVPWRMIWLDHGVLIGVNASEQDRFSFISPDGSTVRSVAGPFLGT